MPRMNLKLTESLLLEDKGCDCMKEVIAIDFDGTLCENDYPNIGKPHLNVINLALERKKNGAALILWTCREGEMLENAINWCKSYGLEFDTVNNNLPEWVEMFGTNPRKIGATEYWDDRAINTNVF